MRVQSCLLALINLLQLAASQQIWDIWQTTWDRSQLFTRLSLSSPINFQSPSGIGDADIVVNDDQVLQNIWGFGGTLTDSAALTLNTLKARNSGTYQALLNYLFSPTDGANAAGLNYIRVPLGASDFSASVYSFDDNNGDTDFSEFNINASPCYLFSVLKDILAVNPRIRVHVIPWSPPGWMKDSGTMRGGSLNDNLLTTYATYLLKALQGFSSQGIPLYAINIQNEPLNSNPSYPTATLTPTEEATIGRTLRSIMNSNGFGNVKLIGYDHNWNNAGTYAVQLMDAAADVFAGVSFHCYAGSVSNQDAFTSRYPNKEVYFTECSGTIGSDWWSDIKWYMQNIMIGAINRNSGSGLMWNIALDSTGEPMLPGTNSCGNGCRPIVNVDGTSWSVNQEFYAMAQASKAIIPKDNGGPFGQRIGVSVGGTLASGLTVSAFVTGRANTADWLRYSLVVLNSYDRPTGSWNPTSIRTTIEFRDAQAVYTFPVGVTTLWWFAASPSFNGSDTSGEGIYEAYAQTDDGPQQQFLLQFEKDYP